MKEQVNQLQPQTITSEIFMISPAQLAFIADVFTKNFADAMNMRTLSARIQAVARESLRAALKSARKMGEVH